MKDLLLSLYHNQEVFLLALLVAVNLGLGLLAAVKRGDFNLGNVPDFLQNRLLVVMLGYGVAAVLAMVQPQLAASQDAAFVALAVYMVKHIADNAADLGLPLPKS